MALNHCPYCNGNNTAALGPVAFSGSIVVEHQCNCCGRLFCIMDRRGNTEHKFTEHRFDKNLLRATEVTHE